MVIFFPYPNAPVFLPISWLAALYIWPDTTSALGERLEGVSLLLLTKD